MTSNSPSATLAGTDPASADSSTSTEIPGSADIPGTQADSGEMADSGAQAHLGQSGDPGQPPSLAERIAAFPFWYHRIPLPGGVVTPGWAPLDAAAYQIPEQLEGKRVLDIGAWDGYWTFEALRRGAREVVAIDDFSDYLGSLKEEDRKAWQTFDLCREALGYGEDRCKRREISVYSISREELGEFDVVFAFGLIYHLRYPLYALDQISKVCKGEIYLESAILDDFSPYRGGLQRGYPGGQLVMEFYPDDQYGHNHTNWWVPSLHCLAHMVRAAGFGDVKGWKLRAQPQTLAECRGFVRGRKQSAELQGEKC